MEEEDGLVRRTNEKKRIDREGKGCARDGDCEREGEKWKKEKEAMRLREREERILREIKGDA